MAEYKAPVMLYIYNSSLGRGGRLGLGITKLRGSELTNVHPLCQSRCPIGVKRSRIPKKDIDFSKIDPFCHDDTCQCYCRKRKLEKCGVGEIFTLSNECLSSRRSNTSEDKSDYIDCIASWVRIILGNLKL